MNFIAQTATRAALRAAAALAAVTTATLATAAAPAQPAAHASIRPHATVSIRVAGSGRRENPHMWGIFIEDINNCVDGGVFAQLIRNPDFQNAVPPPDCKATGNQWRLPNGNLIAPPPGGALYGWSSDPHHPLSLRVIASHPLSSAHPLALQMNSTRPNGTVINSGYWGMNVRAGHKYQLSFYARVPAADPQAVAASFINPSGNPVSGRVTVPIRGAHWRRYNLIIDALKTCPRARLAIALQRPGSVDITLVLLLPINRATGKPQIFRPDLLRLLKNLHPGFMRFPGGNYVEGVSIGDSYNWTQTVGPMIDRPGHFNCWGYRNTDGFGFLQYLELCQKIHAVPLYGTFAGLPLGYFYPVNPLPSATGSALRPIIHRMLSAVAFANDPVNTRWGMLRAKDGHPSPFGLKYVELGNENGGPLYVKNALRMAAALKRKFPGVVPIRTAWSDRLAKVVPLGDEHYYASPDMFYVDSTEFNTRPRRTPIRSFVGEYAVIGDCGKFGDMRGALAEAAYMTGMERNCDVVRMASYAPLFQNTDGFQWRPNLIEFNSSKAFGRSSYWVQWMFSRNRPQIVYPTHVKAVFKPSIGGRIALKTQSCEAAFSGIRVTVGNKTLMHTGPHQKWGGLPNWYSMTWHAGWGPDWRIADGIISQAGIAVGNQTTAFGRLAWANYTLRLRVKKLSGKGAIAIQVRRDPAGLNAAELQLGGPANNTFALRAIHDRQDVVLASKPGHLAIGKWYRVKIVLQGQKVSTFLDGRHLFTQVVHDTPPRFFADAGVNAAHRQLIIKLTNTLGYTMPARMNITGLSLRAAAAKVITLSARRPTEENTYAHPLRISPKISTCRIQGPRFVYRCKPYSLTVLRIAIK